MVAVIGLKVSSSIRNKHKQSLVPPHRAGGGAPTQIAGSEGGEWEPRPRGEVGFDEATVFDQPPHRAGGGAPTQIRRL